MSSRMPPPGKPPYRADSVATIDTLRCPPPGLAPDLGDHDTIAVPLTSADTLPCPRLDMDELPTLRTTPGELAVLVALTKPPPARPQTVPLRPALTPRRIEPPRAQPLNATLRNAPQLRRIDCPPDRTPAVRRPDPGPDMPTQLWFAPGAALVRPTQPTRRSWWGRLWALLGFAGSARRQSPARHPGYHRQPIMRR